MQKEKLFFSLVLGGLLLMQVSCTTYSYTSRSTQVSQRVINSSEATADIKIDYSKKVSASSDYQKFPNQAKQQAIYQCIMNSGIDVLVDPIFQVENRTGAGYRATVVGFAGHYQVGKNGLDEVIEKKYKQEDIEKYLLLTDPNFMNVYYQRNSSGGNTYNIKCSSQSSKASSSITQLSSTNIQVKGKKKAPKKIKLSKLFKKEF